MTTRVAPLAAKLVHDNGMCLAGWFDLRPIESFSMNGSAA